MNCFFPPSPPFFFLTFLYQIRNSFMFGRNVDISGYLGILIERFLMNSMFDIPEKQGKLFFSSTRLRPAQYFPQRIWIRLLIIQRAFLGVTSPILSSLPSMNLSGKYKRPHTGKKLQVQYRQYWRVLGCACMPRSLFNVLNRAGQNIHAKRSIILCCQPVWNLHKM